MGPGWPSAAGPRHRQTARRFGTFGIAGAVATDDGGLPVTRSPARPPALTALEAADRLDLTGLPFLIFLDAARGRGSVVYRRIDGDCAVLLPGC